MWFDLHNCNDLITPTNIPKQYEETPVHFSQHWLIPIFPNNNRKNLRKVVYCLSH